MTQFLRVIHVAASQHGKGRGRPVNRSTGIPDARLYQVYFDNRPPFQSSLQLYGIPPPPTPDNKTEPDGVSWSFSWVIDYVRVIHMVANPLFGTGRGFKREKNVAKGLTRGSQGYILRILPVDFG